MWFQLDYTYSYFLVAFVFIHKTCFLFYRLLNVTLPFPFYLHFLMMYLLLLTSCAIPVPSVFSSFFKNYSLSPSSNPICIDSVLVVRVQHSAAEATSFVFDTVWNMNWNLLLFCHTYYSYSVLWHNWTIHAEAVSPIVNWSSQ